MSLIFTNPNPKVKLSEFFKKLFFFFFFSISSSCYSRSDFVRKTRESLVGQDDELVFSDDIHASATATSNSKKSAASEQVQVRLEFPGNEYTRPQRATLSKGMCHNNPIKAGCFCLGLE